MTTLLVVSPHLDDAVLSCGGAMLARARLGERVVVATVFSEGRDHARRREEDRRAVELLGAEVMHLGLFDAPERLGLERSHRALVEEPVVSPSDEALVRDAVRTAVGRTQPAEIWAPLGVGGHVDHRVVHAALRDRAGLVLYEDRPYAFLAGAVRARLVELRLRARACADDPLEAAAVRDLEHAPDRALVREAVDTLPHLRAYLTDDAAGWRSRDWLTDRQALVRAGTGGETLYARVTFHDAETRDMVERAIGAYGSQVGDLFGGAARIGPALRRAALALASGAAAAHHAERSFAMTSA
jgi:LmbE family N-acetylglucosaminyl deacetylase